MVEFTENRGTLAAINTTPAVKIRMQEEQARIRWASIIRDAVRACLANPVYSFDPISIYITAPPNNFNKVEPDELNN